MHKSNKSIAGYHILMILSAVDDNFAPEEGLKIQEYLTQEFPFRMNLDDELDTIATLRKEDWEKHFTFHAQCFLEDSTLEERTHFLAFAKTLIKSDDQVADIEHQYYNLLKNLWT